MIEHSPWIGKNYTSGIAGQKLAIVGYSHWLDKGESDHPDITVNVVSKVVDKTWNIAFFNQIRNYFDFTEHDEFWNKVMFFNFIPFSIGTPEHRFDNANHEQITIARARFFRLLENFEPEKLIVFSKKGWGQLPASLEEEQGGHCKPLGQNFPTYFERGTYRRNEKLIAAYGLRHTQGATFSVMKTAIDHILTDSMPSARR